MPFIASFYYTGEAQKPRTQRVYHNNSACAAGQSILITERLASTGGHHICDECGRLNSRDAMNR